MADLSARIFSFRASKRGLIEILRDVLAGFCGCGAYVARMPQTLLCRCTLLIVPLAFALGACEQPATDDVDDSGPAWPTPDHGALATDYRGPSDVEGGLTDALAAAEIEPVGYGRFVTSSGCSFCHSNSPQATAMRDSEGNEIAPFNLWQGTMMANSARDPFWRAMVSAEKARTPAAAEAIETECIRCHAPMASVTAADINVTPSMTWANEGEA